MNIDDRLAALTESVELLASLQRDNEKRIDRLAQLTTEIAEGTARLLHVAESHERRISDLEGNRPQ
jgi:hypothetical protein